MKRVLDDVKFEDLGYKNFVDDAYRNISGELLTEYEECKSTLDCNAEWMQYEEDLAQYNMAMQSLNCANLAPPAQPNYQTLIANPVDSCDTAINAKAKTVNANMKAAYDAAYADYQNKKSQCDALVKPTEPTCSGGIVDETSTISFLGFGNMGKISPIMWLGIGVLAYFAIKNKWLETIKL